MGCTHYPLLLKVIQDVVGNKVVLIDSAKEVTKEAKMILDSTGLLNSSGRNGRSSFFVSDEPSRFVAVAEAFLKKKISCVKRAV
jgi:glutamate racemase